MRILKFDLQERIDKKSYISYFIYGWRVSVSFEFIETFGLILQTEIISVMGTEMV